MPISYEATSSSAKLPLVTLGVPVHNGERYLVAALGSLLAQDYQNLEILISDNASSDSTEAICRKFAADNSRVRYIRQETNIGAKKNFEFLVAEARGTYFAWCAHDDIRKPRFVSACVGALEQNPAAVLCNGAVIFLNEEGAVRADWDDLNFETVGMTTAERMLRLVDHTDWVDMLGLIRVELLRHALPFESAWGSDVVLSMKLLTAGHFLKVPEVLLEYRVRSTPKSIQKTMREITGGDESPVHPYLDMLESMLRTALSAIASVEDREVFFQQFLHVLAGLQPNGPHPSWCEAIAPECEPQGRPELAPINIVKRLLPSLRQDISVDTYLNVRLRSILVACPNHKWSLNVIPDLVARLGRKFPNARLNLIGTPHSLARMPPLGEANRFLVPSQWSRSALQALTRELIEQQVDLAIHPGSDRKDVALDICVTGCGAFRTIGFRSAHRSVSRELAGRILKRYRIKDMNEAFTHLLDFNPEVDRTSQIIDVLDCSHPNQGKNATGEK